MATSGKGPLQATFDLYKIMDDDLAAAHATAQYEKRTIDDGWDQIPDQVRAAEDQLGQLKAPSESRKQKRAEARHIRSVNEALGETHSALVERAAAQTNYLNIEAGVKKEIDASASGDMVGLDMARERLQKASENLSTSRMILLTDLENLAADLGLWEK